MLCLLLSAAFCVANGVTVTFGDGAPVTLIKASSYGGPDKSSSISASIDGHYLTVVFTENLGQVAIDVSLVDGGEIETTTTYTPSGVIIYIPVNGRYIVTFVLPNGDEYYGEFEVTD